MLVLAWCRLTLVLVLLVLAWWRLTLVLVLLVLVPLASPLPLRLLCNPLPWHRPSARRRHRSADCSQVGSRPSARQRPTRGVHRNGWARRAVEAGRQGWGAIVSWLTLVLLPLLLVPLVS